MIPRSSGMGRANSETFEKLPLSTVPKGGLKHAHYGSHGPSHRLPGAPGVKEVTLSTSMELLSH